MSSVKRIAAALERIADHVQESNHGPDRIGELTQLLRRFVRIMETPHAADDVWLDLLNDVKGAIER